jgi:hypothetical protein
MNPNSLGFTTEPTAPRVRADETIRLPMVLSARVANLVMTAQVQLAYACAIDARSSAERALESMERSWPDTPVRQMLQDLYRAQAQSADLLARNVLAGARSRCGLAFAHL